VLVESATKHPFSGVFEQGAGTLNVTRAHALLLAYAPRASFLPAALDWSDDSACLHNPYMWPYCSQPLYATGVAAVANLTLINGLGVSGTVADVAWVQDAPFSSSDAPLLEVRVFGHHARRNSERRERE
jgi:membrane-bound transcription factor site-1 protease